MFKRVNKVAVSFAMHGCDRSTGGGSSWSQPLTYSTRLMCDHIWWSQVTSQFVTLCHAGHPPPSLLVQQLFLNLLRDLGQAWPLISKTLNPHAPINFFLYEKKKKKNLIDLLMAGDPSHMASERQIIRLKKVIFIFITFRVFSLILLQLAYSLK